MQVQVREELSSLNLVLCVSHVTWLAKRQRPRPNSLISHHAWRNLQSSSWLTIAVPVISHLHVRTLTPAAFSFFRFFSFFLFSSLFLVLSVSFLTFLNLLIAFCFLFSLFSFVFSVILYFIVVYCPFVLYSFFFCSFLPHHFGRLLMRRSSGGFNSPRNKMSEARRA